MKFKSTSLNTTGLFILVFVVGLIGALAWTTVSRDNITQNITNTEKEGSNQIKPTSKTASWDTEVIEKYGINFKYPAKDEWATTFGVVDSLLPGHEAVVGVNYTKCGPSCGPALSIGIFHKESEAGSQKDFGDERIKDNNHYTLNSKETVTLDGVGGTRWEYTPDTSTAATIIFYYFSNNTFSYTFTVNGNGVVTDGVDLTATGEKIVSTVQFIK